MFYYDSVFLLQEFYSKIEFVSFIPYLFQKKMNYRDAYQEEYQDQLFFHDLINQTHSFNLFLDSKIAENKSMSREEMMMMKQEIKVVQELIQHHFKFTHKNIEVINNFKTFDFLKPDLMATLAVFFPTNHNQIKIEWSGLLAPDIFPLFKDKTIVNMAMMNRIFTNLIKNISENDSSDIYIRFHYDELGPEIFIKNKLQENTVPLISKTKKEKGLGIESITYLCEEEGGMFHFKVEDGYWISKVFLPRPKVSDLINDKKLDKKAA